MKHGNVNKTSKLQNYLTEKKTKTTFKVRNKNNECQ